MGTTFQELRLDAARECDRVAKHIRETVRDLGRRGVVLGLSGGIDSSVCAALAAKALGPARVRGLIMPETDSDPTSERLARLLADYLGLEPVLEGLTPILAAAGCYTRRDEAVRRSFPEFGKGWKMRIARLPGLVARYSLDVEDPSGTRQSVVPAPAELAAIVAATNFKQRTRKMLEYYHADLLRYAVVGTPNRLEYDQGFFVKNGDGSADLKPIAHLYKTQVYALAREMGLPSEIVDQIPTTDTYSLPQTQEEFFFEMPLIMLDKILLAKDTGMPVDAVAEELGISREQVLAAFAEIDRKRESARYLHAAPRTLL